MEFKLDLHIHSVHSIDGFNTIDTINRRIKELGFNGYALADHDSIEGHREAKQKKEDLVLIPSIEVSAKGAHILALDLTELVKPDLSMAETVDLIHDQGATAILAHPYGLPRSWANMGEVKKSGFDAIEVANSAQIPYKHICSLNKRLAENLGLPVTGGSDSHIPETIGRAFTIIDSESPDPIDIVKAIKLGRTKICGSHTRITEWFSKNLRKKNRNRGN